MTLQELHNDGWLYNQSTYRLERKYRDIDLSIELRSHPFSHGILRYENPKLGKVYRIVTNVPEIYSLIDQNLNGDAYKESSVTLTTLQILDALKEYYKRHPGIGFMQGLINLGIIRSPFSSTTPNNIDLLDPEAVLAIIDSNIV